MLVAFGAAGQLLAALGFSQKASRRPVASYVVVDGSIPKPGAADWPMPRSPTSQPRMRPAASRHARPSCVAGRLSRPTTLQWHFVRSSPTHSRQGEADRPGSIAGASARKPLRVGVTCGNFGQVTPTRRGLRETSPTTASRVRSNPWQRFVGQVIGEKVSALVPSPGTGLQER